MADVVLIAGSPSAASRSAALLAATRDLLADQMFATAQITVRDLPAEDLIFGRYDSPAITAQADLIRSARGVVVATPVYKAAYSGTLKAFVDLLPQDILVTKAALPIVTGGGPLHALALDYALIPLLSALGATQIVRGVYVQDSQLPRGADGTFTPDSAATTALQQAVAQFVAVIKTT